MLILSSINPCAAAEDEIDWGDDVITVVSRFTEAFGNTLKELKKIQDAFSLVHPDDSLFQ